MIHTTLTPAQLKRWKIVRQAVAENDSYYQGAYVHMCGAPACIAGTAAFALEATSMRELRATLARMKKEAEDGDDFTLADAYDETDATTRVEQLLGIEDAYIKNRHQPDAYYNPYRLFGGSGCGWPRKWADQWQQTIAHNFKNNVDPNVQAAAQKAIALDLIDTIIANKSLDVLFTP